MKKILLGILLGFVLHKVVHEIYDYSWWKNSNECYDRADGVEPYIPNGVEIREKCFDEKMGLIKYAAYILIRPQIGRHKYFPSDKDKGWGF